MSMTEVQTVVAKLCLDTSFRRDYLARSGAALSGFKLTEAEIAQVTELDVTAVGAFGDRLLHKRIGMIKHWLPLTFRLLEQNGPDEQVEALLLKFTQTFVRDDQEYGGEWARRESGRFVDYLVPFVDRGVIGPPALSSLLRFEYLRLAMTIDPRLAQSAAATGRTRNVLATDGLLIVRPAHVRVERFAVNVPRLVETVERSAPIEHVPEHSCQVLFVRRSGDASVDTMVVGDGSAALLEACEVPRTAREVVAATVQRFAEEGEDTVALSEQCRRELERLFQAGAVIAV